MTQCTDVALDDRAAEVMREHFIDLVCSDEEWLRTEFDAIVATSWGPGKPRWAGRGIPTPPARPREDDYSLRLRGGWSARSSGPDVRAVASHAGRSRSPPEARAW